MSDNEIIEIDRSESPPSCLPSWLDKSNLVDITIVGDAFRKYFDPKTGSIHDGVEYYERAKKMGWYRDLPMR